MNPPAPTSLLYELPTILERIELAKLFPKPQPLEVELGCGDAAFLIEYARQNPGKNFIGVERLLGRIQKLDKKGRRGGLTNTRGVRIESAYFLEFFAAAAMRDGAAYLFSRSVAEEEASPSPQHQ